jgi:hypothetical protein
MSKAVTVKQGLENGSLLIDKEELWSYVEEVWEELLLEAIARAYHSHHQVVNAIAHDKGGDDFIREKKALHFGIRKHCVPYYDSEEAEEPSGVKMMTSWRQQ